MRKEIFISCLLVLIIVVTLSFNYYPNSNIDCDKPFNVVYFKQSERSHISEFLHRNPNGVAVIPELNQMNANTIILECENFNYGDYIK